MSPCCGQSENEPKIEKSKTCTDVLCLLIFGIFWGLLIFIAAFAFVIGNPMRLEYGQDSFGNTCGMKNEELGNMTFSGMDMTDKPYLFFLNMTDLYQSLKICVKQCPYKTLRDEVEVRDFEIDTGSRLCRYDITEYQGRSRLYPDTVNISTERYACPQPPIFATKSIFKRCIPLPVANFASDVIYSIYAYLNSFDTIQKVVSDVYAAKLHILGMMVLAIILSLILVLLIHKLASFVSWIIMVVASIACIAGTCVLWWTYIDLKWQLDSTSINQTLIDSVKNEEAFLVYSIMATIFTTILLLLVLVMRKRVGIVVRLFTEASECIRSMPLILLQPVFTFLALFAFLAFWVAVLVAIATAYYPVRNTVQSNLPFSAPLPPLPANLTHLSVEPTSEKALVNKAFTLVSFTEGSWVQYMWWYHIIALIWTSEFILGCQQMAIAGAVAKWYFCRDRTSLSSPICQSVVSLFLYHMGSVALGAFLITIFKIPRLILTYMITFMRKYQEWKCIAWCLKCCTCCLWCMEKCIRYLNHNAYTIVAIQGVGFCSAAREAFDILMSNALQVATINSVGDFILFLGKCSVTAITAFACIVIFKNDPDLYFYAVPVILICVIAYFIAHCVLSVYEMVIDTLFLCVCEDILRNDGSKEKPYFGGSLVRFVKGTEAGHSLQPLNKVNDNSETE